MDPSKLVHRDDLPIDVAEQVVSAIQNEFPDHKVVFAGDLPATAENAAEVERVMGYIADCGERGVCYGCETPIPNIPQTDDPAAWEAWRIPEDWVCLSFGLGEDSPIGFLCPACEDKVKQINPGEP